MSNTYQLSNGDRITKSVIDSRIRKAKAEVLDNQMKEFGYNFCVECQRSSGVRLDCSHIVSVKTCQEMGCSEMAYSIDNIEIVCRQHHSERDGLDLKFTL